MKMSFAILSVGLVLSGVTVDQATAIGAAGPTSAVYEDNASEGVSLQLVVGGQRYELEREGTADGGLTRFDSSYIAIRLGYDLKDWCTLYGSLGAASADMRNTSIDGDTGLHWDLGTYINLWQQGINEPDILESTLGVMFNTQVSGNYVNGDGGADTTWHDWMTSLAITLDVPNTGHATVQQRRPTSATYYIGPLYAYTDVSVDSPGVSFKAESEFGFLGGASINVTPQFSLIGEYRHLNDLSGFVGTIAYKF
jgi:hypothetical protein